MLDFYVPCMDSPCVFDQFHRKSSNHPSMWRPSWIQKSRSRVRSDQSDQRASVVNASAFQVLGGRPSPRVTWWRDHHLVDDTFTSSSQHKVTNQLVIPNIQRSDLHSIFTCQASNNNVSVPVSTSVKLDITCNTQIS